MKLKLPLLTALMLFLFCINLKAQTPLPYSTGFDTEEEQAEWTQFQLGPEMSSYIWEFPTFSANSAPNSLAHNYPVGGMEITDDWMISPEFDFANGAVIDSLSASFAGFGLPFGIDTVALYLINGSNDPSMAETQTLLKLFTDSTYMNNNIWRTYYDIEIPPTEGDSYIAFRYKTIINWLDVRFDDLFIHGLDAASVETLGNSLDLRIYPNPSNGFLMFKEALPIGAEIFVYDVMGRERISKQANDLGQNLDLSFLETGLYYLKVIVKEKEVEVQSFIIK